MNIVVKYGKSSSPSYELILKYSRHFTNFKEIPALDKNCLTITDEIEFRNKFKYFRSIVTSIFNWKSTEFYINNDVIANSFDSFKLYFEIIDCYKSFEINEKKEEHCNSYYYKRESWGCKYLRGVRLHLDEYHDKFNQQTKYYYHFGFFKAENIWTIDKQKLKQALLNEVKRMAIDLCPIFSFENINNLIENLPSEIDVSDKSKWDIIYEEEIIGNVLQKVPKTIYHKLEEKDSSNETIVRVLFNNDENESGTKPKLRNIPKIRFSDVGGIDDIIQEIREVIELPLKQPEILKHLGIKPHKGILLYGPPGNGKTLIAKAIANEVQAHFIPVNGPELLSKWHGESEENLRKVFIEARELQPSIIFFDEIDSIGQKRSDSDTARIDSKFVNQLLTLMDGMESYENVTVLASTNRPELLDSALLRHGRFDYKLHIKSPDKNGCYKILSICLNGIPVTNDFNIESFSTELLGLSGADIAFIVKEAAYNCMRRKIDLKNIINGPTTQSINYHDLVVESEDFYKALEVLKNE